MPEYEFLLVTLHGINNRVVLLFSCLSEICCLVVLLFSYFVDSIPHLRRQITKLQDKDNKTKTKTNNKQQDNKTKTKTKQNKTKTK